MFVVFEFLKYKMLVVIFLSKRDHVVNQCSNKNSIFGPLTSPWHNHFFTEGKQNGIRRCQLCEINSRNLADLSIHKCI